MALQAYQEILVIHRYSKYTSSIARWLLLGILALSTSASVMAQEPEACGSCQGRCQYGVDGTCRPNRTTFGYYQSNWRRWPEPAPAVPQRISTGGRDRNPSPSVPETPTPDVEADLEPEFSHLQKKPGFGRKQGGTVMPPLNKTERLPLNHGGDMIDLPGPAEEGLLDQSRNMRGRRPTGGQPQATAQPTVGYPNVRENNPLRGAIQTVPMTRTVPAAAAFDPSRPHQVRTVSAIEATPQPPFAALGRSSNPLR